MPYIKKTWVDDELITKEAMNRIEEGVFNAAEATHNHDTTYAPLVHNHMYNVLDFGAKGDGVTDDTAAFAAAIKKSLDDEVPVYIPGKYKFFLDSVPPEGFTCHKWISKLSVEAQPNNRRSVVMLGDGANYSHIIWSAKNKADVLFEHAEFPVFKGFMVTDIRNQKDKVSGHGWVELQDYKGIIFATSQTAQTLNGIFEDLRIYGSFYMSFYRRFTMLESYRDIFSAGVCCHFCFALGDGGLEMTTGGRILKEANGTVVDRQYTTADRAQCISYPWRAPKNAWNANGKGTPGYQGWFHNGVSMDNVTCEGGECGVFGGLMCSHIGLICCQNMEHGPLPPTFVNTSDSYVGLWFKGLGGDQLKTNVIGTYYTEVVEEPFKVEQSLPLHVQSAFCQGHWGGDTARYYHLATVTYASMKIESLSISGTMNSSPLNNGKLFIGAGATTTTSKTGTCVAKSNTWDTPTNI